MTDKNRREEYDEIIKMSIEMNKENDDELKELTDEDVIKMGYELPPDDMYDRIIKAAEQSKPRIKRKSNTKIYVLAAVIAGTLAIGFGAYGVRVYVYKIEGNVTENAIEFRGTNENAYTYEASESEAYKNAEDALGTKILKPTYLPEGFEFDKIKLYPDDSVILIYKSNKKTIKLKQELITGQTLTKKSVDEKNGHIYTFNINEQEIEIGEQIQLNTNDKWLSACWNNQQLLYTIDTNCEKKELEKFIQNLK